MASGTFTQPALTSRAGSDLRGGISAVAAGICGLLYAIAFVVLQNPLLSALCLMLGGLLTAVAVAALYERVRESDPGGARLGFVLSVAGAFGAAIHGGYDLANAMHPPPAGADQLSAIDPRGLLTFGVAGLGLFAFAALLSRRGERLLGGLAALLAALLVIIYLARLIVLDPTNPLLLIPVLLSGFIVNPAWLLLLGATLLRDRQ